MNMCQKKTSTIGHGHHRIQCRSPSGTGDETEIHAGGGALASLKHNGSVKKVNKPEHFFFLLKEKSRKMAYGWNMARPFFYYLHTMRSWYFLFERTHIAHRTTTMARATMARTFVLYTWPEGLLSAIWSTSFNRPKPFRFNCIRCCWVAGRRTYSGPERKHSQYTAISSSWIHGIYLFFSVAFSKPSIFGNLKAQYCSAFSHGCRSLHGRAPPDWQ